MFIWNCLFWALSTVSSHKHHLSKLFMERALVLPMSLKIEKTGWQHYLVAPHLPQHLLPPPPPATTMFWDFLGWQSVVILLNALTLGDCFVSHQCATVQIPSNGWFQWRKDMARHFVFIFWLHVLKFKGDKGGYNVTAILRLDIFFWNDAFVSVCLVTLKWLVPFEEILWKGQCRWEMSHLHLSHVLSGLGLVCFFLISPQLVFCYCLWVCFDPSLCSSTALLFFDL